MSKKIDFVIRVNESANGGYAIKHYPAGSYDEGEETLEVFVSLPKAVKRAKEIIAAGFANELYPEKEAE